MNKTRLINFRCDENEYLEFSRTAEDYNKPLSVLIRELLKEAAERKREAAQ